MQTKKIVPGLVRDVLCARAKALGKSAVKKHFSTPVAHGAPCMGMRVSLTIIKNKAPAQQFHGHLGPRIEPVLPGDVPVGGRELFEVATDDF